MKNKLLQDLSRDIIAALAPHELPMFSLASAAYFRDPQAVFKYKPGQDQKLGFGGSGEVAAITPAVLAIMTPVIAFITQEISASMDQKGESGLESLFTPLPAATAKRAELLQKLSIHFSLEELKTLCFLLHIDSDAFGPVEKDPFIRELILYCERRNQVPTLISNCRDMRPDVEWETPKQAAEPRVTWRSDQLKKLRELVLVTGARANLPEVIGSEIADKLILSLVAA